MLRRTEASNLFLVPLDRKREWYRYHHLFADLLQIELRGRDARPAHRRAAVWHLEQGLVSEAVRHYVAAGEVAQAAEAIALRWLVALTTGGHDAVDRWLDALPEQTVRSDARLAVARAMSCISKGQVEAVDGWIEAVADAKPAGPAYDALRIARGRGEVLAGRASLADRGCRRDGQRGRDGLGGRWAGRALGRSHPHGVRCRPVLER